MRESALLCLLLVTPAGCSTQSREAPSAASQAVTNATSDAADPAVVALVDSSGSLLCSGTLISPHVVLTAAHCQIDSTNFPQYSAYFGATLAGGGTTVALSGATVHPAFDPDTLANDVAMVVLASDVAMTPVPMLQSGAALSGATVRVVGFGLADDAGSGGKRSGTASVTSTTATTFALAPDPSLPCEGDSGGPELLTVGGTEYIAGVTSHGDGACVMQATATRVDAYLASFIEPYLASIAVGTAAPGARCLYPEQCATGACVTAGDDPNVSYCASMCTTSSACPAGTACTGASGGSRCLYPYPTPGALGSHCSSDSDCVGTQCTSLGQCSIPCVPDSPNCPSGFDCESATGGDFCIAQPTPGPSASGGCATSPRRARAPARETFLGLAGLLLVAVAWARRRS